MRDSQRSKVYRSEKVVPQGLQFKELADVQAYLKQLQSHAWFRRRWAPRDFHLKDGRGARRGRASHGWWARIITLPRATRYQSYVLHEVAHHLAGLNERHGPKFCRVYWTLVRYEFGPEAAKALKTEWAKNRVRWRKKRRLSPETLAALRQRGRELAAAGRRAREESA